jgi:hypothetical protein
VTLHRKSRWPSADTPLARLKHLDNTIADMNLEGRGGVAFLAKVLLKIQEIRFAIAYKSCKSSRQTIIEALDIKDATRSASGIRRDITSRGHLLQLFRKVSLDCYERQAEG